MTGRQGAGLGIGTWGRRERQHPILGRARTRDGSRTDGQSVILIERGNIGSCWRS